MLKNLVKEIRLEERGKPLAQPEIGPPLRGDQIAEPLMYKFMRYQRRYVFSLKCRLGAVIVDNVGLAERQNIIHNLIKQNIYLSSRIHSLIYNYLIFLLRG